MSVVLSLLNKTSSTLLYLIHDCASLFSADFRADLPTPLISSRCLARTVGRDAGVVVGYVAAIRFLNMKAGSSGAPRPTE
jgi:hypothetical protein